MNLCDRACSAAVGWWRWLRLPAVGPAETTGLRTLVVSLAAFFVFSGSSLSAAAQLRTAVLGQVVDQDTRSPVSGVEISIEGIGVRVTDAQGFFAFNWVPAGGFVLQVSHVAYGTHEMDLDKDSDPVRVTVEISREAIRLAPLVVEGMGRRERERRGTGHQINRIGREEIQAYEDTSMRLVDVLTARVPGVRTTRSGVVGQPICLEFRGARSGNFIRGLGSTDPGCNSPEVYLDGVRVHGPATLYATLPIETIETIEVVPPSEAGARFGTGSLWGALLIETRKPWLDRDEAAVSSAATGPHRHDWSLETGPHRSGQVFLGAAAGNAIGLVAGIGVGSQCIGFRDSGDHSVVFGCNGTATVAAAVAAVGLPALGAALGARFAGATERSRGTLGAALIGAGVILIPGYALGIASRRDDSDVLAGAGLVTLAIAVPVVTTVADRLFRSLGGSGGTGEGPGGR